MSNEPTILVIDDEPQIRRFMRASLPPKGYRLLEAADGSEGIAMAASHNPDVILLDLGLPDIEGLDVTKRIREWSTTPIIILSARGDEDHKIGALDAGANDYVTKPFSIGELLARIRVALRHAALPPGAGPGPVFEAGDLRVDLAARRVSRADQEIHLTPIEYKLLVTLIRYRGRVVTQKQLLTEVWGPNHSRQSHYLRIYMGKLRHKVEENPAKPRYLCTEPGVGFRFKE